MPRAKRESDLTDEGFNNHSDKIARREFTNTDRIHPIDADWSEFTFAGKRRYITRKVVGTVAIAGIIYASLPNGSVDFWGDGGEPVSIEAQRADARLNALDRYSMQSVEGKFTKQYIMQESGFVDGVQNENGLLGTFINNGNPDLAYRFGQTCLAGSAYDTTPSSIRGGATGEVSAVAALNYDSETNQATVYPASSDANPLVFTVVPWGNTLIPDAQTTDTLIAYDCQPEGLVIEEADNPRNPRVWTQAPEK